MSGRSRAPRRAPPPAPGLWDHHRGSEEIYPGSGDNSVAQEQLAQSAALVQAQVEQIRDVAVPEWTLAKDGIDGVAVRVAGGLIEDSWLLAAMADTNIDLIGEGMAVAPSTAPEVVRARHGLLMARRDIGLHVGLQALDGAPVVSLSVAPVADVPEFVAQRTEEAERAADLAVAIMRHIGNAPREGDRVDLDEDTFDAIIDLVRQTRRIEEERFVREVVRRSRLGGPVADRISRDGDFLEHHTRLRELSFLEQAIPGVDLSPEMLQRMQRHAEQLEGEKDHLGVPEEVVWRILDAFDTPELLEPFLVILDRRALIDPLIKRNDTQRMYRLLDRTDRFRGRRYRRDLDVSTTLAEAANQIDAEAGRQLPGATLYFFAGVYDSMSHIPIIGGVFAKAAKSFRDLGKEADQWTGAGTEGREARNMVAGTTGLVVGHIAQAATVKEMGAAKGGSALNSTLKVADTAQDLEDFRRFLVDLQDGFDAAKGVYTAVMDSMIVAPVIASQIGTGDYAGAADSVGSLMDGYIGLLRGHLQQGWTVSGRRGRVQRRIDRMDEDALRRDDGQREYVEAAQHFADVEQRIGAKGLGEISGEDRVDMIAAAGRLRGAAMAQQAGAPRGDTLAGSDSRTTSERVHDGVHDALKSGLLWIAEQLLVFLRGLLTDALKEAAGWNGDPAGDDDDPRSFGQRIADNVAAAAGAKAPHVVAFIVKWVNGLIGKAVKAAVAKKWPQFEAISGEIGTGVANLLDHAHDSFDVRSLYDGPVERVVGDFVRGLGAAAGLQD